MDTNNDGVIDDPLVIKRKVGRPSLGLTDKEMKERRAVQRKLRKYNKDLRQRSVDVTNLVDEIVMLSIKHNAEEIIGRIVRDKRWEIKFNPDATSISGSGSERLHGKKN